MAYKLDFRDAEYMYTLGGQRIYFPKADAYKGIIKNAYQSVSQSGNKMLVVELDIDEGAFKGFFQKLKDTKAALNKNGMAYWELKYYILLEGSTHSNNRLRTFLTCVEADNESYQWDWHNPDNLETLQGKSCCFILNYDFVWSAEIGTYEKRVKIDGVLSEANMKQGNYKVRWVPNPEKRDKVRIQMEADIHDNR